MRELQRQADPSIVIMLVGNKLDLEASRKTPRELGERFAEEEGLLFAEASAKTGDGVEGLFMEIGMSSRFNYDRLYLTDLQPKSYLFSPCLRDRPDQVGRVSKSKDRTRRRRRQHATADVRSPVLEHRFSPYTL